jgi:uncharacterized protein
VQDRTAAEVVSALDVATECNYTMKLEWDEAKRAANLKKHGIDFMGAEVTFAGDTLTIEDRRLDYGERRFITFGVLEGRIVAMVHTEKANIIRLISIRKATHSETKSFLSTLSN